MRVDYSKKYINPYNFVQLNKDGCNREDKTIYNGNLTGYIECVLTTKTPLIIPDTSEENTVMESSHPHYKFYNYGDKKPIIPGSELRGMLRSDFELFTNSCMSSINADKTFIARTKEIKKPGLLIKQNDGKWTLYQANRYAICTYSNRKEQENLERTRKYQQVGHFKVNRNNSTLIINNKIIQTGEKVTFEIKGTLVKNITERSQNVHTGILFIGETGMRKTKDSIFEKKSQKVEDIKNEDIEKGIEKLKEIYELYNDSAYNKNLNNNKETWYGGYNIKKMEQNGIIPVWYEVFDKKLYLSLAAIGKEEYYRKLDELVNVANNKEKSYAPCIDKMHLCDACNLFGFVSDDEAKGSKIRVSDATYIEQEGKNPYLKEEVLQELATPRISNSIFYSLYKTNKDLIKSGSSNFDWNYDFAFMGKNKTTLQDSEIKIRGRKCFWHHQPDMGKKIEKTKRNASVIPLNVDNSFKFKVFFENITEEDLKKLIAVINLNYTKDNYHNLCHKLGRGKPLGYGSVKITTNAIKVRNIKIENNKIKYEMQDHMLTETALDEVFKNQIETISFKEALRIYDFNYIKRNYPESIVNYPQGISKKGQQASLFWFTQNRTAKLGNPYVNMVLPTISEGKEIEENDSGLQGKVLRNGKEIVKIDGLNMPVFIEY